MTTWIAKIIARFFVKKKKKSGDLEKLELTREETLRIKKDRAIEEWKEEINRKK